MDYISFIKQDLDKILFIEIGKDLVMKNGAVLEKGEYPIHSNDMINVANSKNSDIPLNHIINGMVYLLACDPKFKFNETYLNFIKSINGIESYIIKTIEDNKEKDVRKAVIYATTLCKLNSKKEYLYNRAVLLISLYEELKLQFIIDEIINSLESIVKEHEDFTMPHFQLGVYYSEKDLDLAKHHFRLCLNDPKIKDEAESYLEEIGLVENYDNAVEMVKQGNGAEVLESLITFSEKNPHDPNAKYFTAIALRQAGYNENALVYLKELIEFGETANVLSEIGLNLASLSEFEAAIEYFEKALEVDKNNEVLICNIGVCYINLGKFDDAREKFEFALKVNPKDEIAKEWLERI